MINFLEVYEHLLPYARAWQLTINKQLRQFIDGLSRLPKDIVNFYDLIFLDILPDTTRQIDNWEFQFGLQNANLTETERRNRLDAYWKDRGGQSPRYLQDILQDNGFDVYVHEWWVPGTEPIVNSQSCATPRNPLQYLSDDGVLKYTIQCREPLAQCGEPLAQCGQTAGKLGYALVNKVYVSTLAYMQCGEPLAQCGESLAQCGETLGYGQTLKKYIIPNDVAKFPYFLYIGGETFGDFATISPNRRGEFERLVLKISPAQQWLGIMVQYT